MRLFELPCEGWQGWHMHSGKLWTPEGFGFTPDCQSWWSLLVRQARLFRQMAERERQLDIAMQSTLHGSVRMTQSGHVADAQHASGPVASDAPSGAAGRAAKPTGPNLLLEHFPPRDVENCLFHWENQFGQIPVIRSVVTNKGGV